MLLQLVRTEGFPLQWGLHLHFLQGFIYVAPIREVFPDCHPLLLHHFALFSVSSEFSYMIHSFLFQFHPQPRESRYFVLYAAFFSVQCLVPCLAHSPNKDLWRVWMKDLNNKVQIIKFCLYGSLCKQKLIFFWSFRIQSSFFNWSMVDVQCCVSFWYTAKWLSYKNEMKVSCIVVSNSLRSHGL